MNEVQLTEKLNLEIKKFKKMQQMFLGKKTSEKIVSINLQDYLKFIMKEGSILEKRGILECLNNEIFMKNKSIFVK